MTHSAGPSSGVFGGGSPEHSAATDSETGEEDGGMFRLSPEQGSTKKHGDSSPESPSHEPLPAPAQAAPNTGALTSRAFGRDVTVSAPRAAFDAAAGSTAAGYASSTTDWDSGEEEEGGGEGGAASPPSPRHHQRTETADCTDKATTPTSAQPATLGSGASNGMGFGGGMRRAGKLGGDTLAETTPPTHASVPTLARVSNSSLGASAQSAVAAPTMQRQSSDSSATPGAGAAKASGAKWRSPAMRARQAAERDADDFPPPPEDPETEARRAAARAVAAAAGGGSASGSAGTSSHQPSCQPVSQSVDDSTLSRSARKIARYMSAAEHEQGGFPEPAGGRAGGVDSAFWSSGWQVYGLCSAQGPRSSMEDAHATYMPPPSAAVEAGCFALFCLFDGHAGNVASAFAASHLPTLLRSHPLLLQDTPLALMQSFHATDAHFLRAAVAFTAADEVQMSIHGPLPPAKWGERPRLSRIDDHSPAAASASISTLNAWGGEGGPSHEAFPSMLGTTSQRDLQPPGHTEGVMGGGKRGGTSQATDTSPSAADEAAASEEFGGVSTEVARSVRVTSFTTPAQDRSVLGGNTCDHSCTFDPAALLPPGALPQAAFDAMCRKEQLTRAYNSGTTALAVLLDLRRNVLVTGNVGDTMVVLARQQAKVGVAACVEHSPASERSRIEVAGGWVHYEEEMALSQLDAMDLDDAFVRARAKAEVSWHKISRVNSELGVSRALGDLNYKGRRKHFAAPRAAGGGAAVQFSADLVLPTPDVAEIPLEAGDEFMILACDGVWEVMSAGDAVLVASMALERPGSSPASAARHLTEMALKLGSSDNITALVVMLPTAVRFKHLIGRQSQ